MACGKPSGDFSNNSAEGYRISCPKKNPAKSYEPKERIQSMGKGRITKKEQEYRIGMLLKFIFILAQVNLSALAN